MDLQIAQTKDGYLNIYNGDERTNILVSFDCLKLTHRIAHGQAEAYIEGYKSGFVAGQWDIMGQTKSN